MASCWQIAILKFKQMDSPPSYFDVSNCFVVIFYSTTWYLLIDQLSNKVSGHQMVCYLQHSMME